MSCIPNWIDWRRREESDFLPGNGYLLLERAGAAGTLHSQLGPQLQSGPHLQGWQEQCLLAHLSVISVFLSVRLGLEEIYA
jgi:hypothetical protein